jgi:hypothetical protein
MLVYYTLVLNTAKLGGNIFLNFFLTFAVDIGIA